ncbi:MAG: trk system potassium uptake protein TrkH [Flavobacteriales bacterium]|jgi:trk system potassium uptake protein TrkH|tara:strand:+ start:7191 stop:9029 length:1839 start_codon:yes stop_codon:yes gene_type:complete
MGILRNIEERTKLFLYNNKNVTLRSLRFISVIIGFFALGLMVYYYGFQHNDAENEKLVSYFKGLFGYYVLSYVVRILYSFDVKDFFKNSWHEFVLLLLLTIDATGFYFFDSNLLQGFFESLGSNNPQDWYVIFMQSYLLILAYFEVGKININLSKIRLNPAILFILIFAGIIFGGAGMLMLPEMTNASVDSDWDFIDAVFTSASATCVTGLMVEETGTFFTFQGQLVLMFLIKLGGLNIVAFGIFMAVFSRFGIGVKQHDIIEDIVNKSNYQSAQGLFTKIFIISTLIELVGSVCLFFLLPETSEIALVSDRIFYSIFHSVSAFNNAGISLYEGGITNPAVAQCYPVLSIMGVLIFLGALGFVTIIDVLNIKDLRERMMKPWKKLDIGSRVGLVSNTHLLIFGIIVFLLLEWNTGLFGAENFFERFISAGFQIVNRTAGFASIETGTLAIPVIILMLVLMFIGGSSSSTAGGIKTSTFTLLIVSVYTTIRGKKNAELYNKNIANDLLIKAYAVLLFTLLNLFIWIFLLTITEGAALANGKIKILELVFEEFSAFSTVGLSMGVTQEFSDLGLIILSISMFIGRLGTLMLIMALSKKVKTNRYKYPDAHIMIG